MGLPRGAQQPAGRNDIDDPPPTTNHHAASHLSNAVKRSVQVDGEDISPTPAVHEYEEAIVCETGVVDEYVHGSEPLLDLPEKLFDLPLVTHVTLLADAWALRGALGA